MCVHIILRNRQTNGIETEGELNVTVCTLQCIAD